MQTPAARTEGNALAPGQAGGNSRARAVAAALALWGLAYAGYRAYYAAGGQLGMIGRPLSDAQFRTINAFGAGIVLLGAVMPVVLVRFPVLRPTAPVLGWLVGVGCCMHALVDSILRLLSISGVHPTQLPAEVWRSFDRHAADLQDLLLNEPWFFVEGLLWAALGLAFVQGLRRRAWLVSAASACVVLTTVGVLSGLELIGSFRLG